MEEPFYVAVIVLATTMLICAAKIGDEQLDQQLLEMKADVNAHDVYHKSALSYAVGNNSRNLVQILLENGARVD